MQPPELFDKVIQTGSDCIKRITPEQLTNATPCTDWNLRQLLNHMVNELRWVPDMLAGKTVEEVGSIYDGDLLGDNFHAAWLDAVEKAAHAIASADLQKTVHLSYADKSAGDYITEVASDLLIHTWDVGQSIQCSERFEDEMVKEAYEYLLPMAEMGREAGVYAKAVKVDENAPLMHKLLGITGREPASAAVNE